MKKTTTTLALLAVLSLANTSCQKENLIEENTSIVVQANTVRNVVYTVHTLFRQIIIPMRNTGLITLDGVTDMTETINTLLRQLSLNEQLSSSINGAIASIGKADVMRTIAQVLTEEI